MGRGAVVFAFAVAVSLGTAAHPQNTTNAEANQSSEIQQASARVADAIHTVRPEEDKGCEGAEDKPTSNLCAQWKAAEAARRAASATWFAVLFSFLGTTLVALTFWEQRKVSRAELRPYLFVEKIEVEQRGERTFQVTIWLKNFGRTPARNIQAQIKAYAAEGVSDLREFAPDECMELSAAAPNHQRRALWWLDFTEEEWAAPSWACYGILRLAYTYADDEGNSFDEAFDYYTNRCDLDELTEPVFFLLTEWTKGRHADHRANEPDLFSAEVIERIREANLTAEREYRDREQRELRRQMNRLRKPAKSAKPAKAKPRAKRAPPKKHDA